MMSYLRQKVDHDLQKYRHLQMSFTLQELAKIGKDDRYNKVKKST